LTYKASIIIPAHNEQSNISNCLGAVLRTKEEIEIIVVNDASTDQTPEILTQFDVKVINLESNQGVSAARNAGARVASSDLLIFIDSDVVVSEGSIERMVHHMDKHRDLSAIGGVPTLPENYKSELNFETIRSIWRYEKIRKNFISHCSCFQSQFGAIRKHTFIRIGQFDETYKKPGGEEYDLGHRLLNAQLNNRIYLDCTFFCLEMNTFNRCIDLIYKMKNFFAITKKSRSLQTEGTYGTKRDLLSCIFTFLILITLPVSILNQSIALILLTLGLLAHLVQEASLVIFTLKRQRYTLALTIIPSTILINLSLGLGLIYGLYQYLLKKKSN
jgi:glycosyltransferase involved in cell wall biosynthesis